MNGMKKRKGFSHQAQKSWRGRYYQLLEKHHIPLPLVEDFGDLLEIIQGEIIAPKVECHWMGGSVCNGAEGTLDLILRVPSFSKKGQFYLVVLKLDKSLMGQNILNITETPSHFCQETGIKHITRLPGPCHHIIAAYKALQCRLPEWCQNKGIEKRYFLRYRNFTYWLREKESPEIIEIFKHLLKKRIPKLEMRRRILEVKMGLYGDKRTELSYLS